VEAVRSASDATTRDQRRERLHAELDRRGLSESPTWVEAALDTLEPGYTPPSTADRVSSLRRFAADVNAALTAPNIDEPVPAWLAPPERAQYHLLISPDSRGAVPVELERDAEDWLNRVYDVRLPLAAWYSSTYGSTGRKIRARSAPRSKPSSDQTVSARSIPLRHGCTRPRLMPPRLVESCP
jgi:hypothetical protein